jgi:hypothetical protein
MVYQPLAPLGGASDSVKMRDIMNFSDEALQFLARRMCGDKLASREEMEAVFVPMIRVAMRTGRGQWVLVEWVARNLPALSSSFSSVDKIDPEWAAPRMARLLCSQMLQKVQAERAWVGPRETVVGR